MKTSFSVVLLSAALLGIPVAHAQVPADLQNKVDAAKVTLGELAKNSGVLSALKESNAKGGIIAGMSNAKWDELSETDPLVKEVDSNPTSKIIQGFADKHPEMNKLYLRDQKGNLVASGSGGKTLLWNVSARPFFKGVMEGKSWSDSSIKPDPTTQVKGVRFAVPVMDGGKAIGLLQSNFTAK